MKIVFISVIFLSFCLTAFAGIATDTSRHDSIIARDGSSFKKAVIITDTTEMAGIKAEYSWLALHYPGYSSTGQSLNINKENHHPYDIIYIKTIDGTKKEVYFDISSYFGKW